MTGITSAPVICDINQSKKSKKMNNLNNPLETALFANLDSVWNDIDFVIAKMNSDQDCRNLFLTSDWGWDYYNDKVKAWEQQLTKLLAERDEIKKQIFEAQTK